MLRLTELWCEPEGAIDVEAHHGLARELAAECAVLLKNDGDVLPLDPTMRIALVGAFAQEPRFQGGGSSHIEATRVEATRDVLSAFVSERGGTVEVAPGFPLDADTAATDDDVAGAAGLLREQAMSLARSTDVAVVFVGLCERDESEGFDRHALDLPAVQVELVRAVAAVAPRTGGRPQPRWRREP